MTELDVARPGPKEARRVERVIGPTASGLDLEDLAGRASAAVQGRAPGASVQSVEQLVGGASSLTYSAKMIRTDAAPTKVVIKAAPPGLEPVRNRDVLRQARLLEFLQPHPRVRVPEVLGQDSGDPVDIPPLFVMTFVDGESYEPLMTPLATSSPDAIAQRCLGAARLAAELHAVDPTRGWVADEPRVDLVDEVNRWARAFDSVEDDLRPGADSVRDRLLAGVPPAGPPVILHGDWRLGNMQCSSSSIDAVIDWEIWSVGDYRLDLAWYLLLLDPAAPSAVRGAAGLPTNEAIIRAYEDVSGHAVEGLDWFAALVRYKRAAVSALITKNNRKRPQPGVDIDHRVGQIGEFLKWAALLLAS